MQDDDTTTVYRRFQGEGLLEALRGWTLQEIATRRKLRPSQVSTWKCPAMEGLGAMFSNGIDKAWMDHNAKSS